MPKKIKLIKIFFLLGILSSSAGIGILISSNNNDIYFSNSNNDPPTYTSTQVQNNYRTTVTYNTTYKRQNISNKKDAIALIKKDSKTQKEKCRVKDIEDIENKIEKNYNVTAVNLCELDITTALELEKVLSFIYTEYPTLKGYITNLSLVNEEDTTGYIVAFMASFPFATSNTISGYPNVKKMHVLFNTSYFLNREYLETTMKNAANDNWFVKDCNIESIISHEFGHFLSFVATMNKYKLDSTLLINRKNSNNYYSLLKNYNSGILAEEIVNKAYNNYKKDSKSNISNYEFRSMISQYAVSIDQQTGKYIYDETIAEAFHDYYLHRNNAMPASKYILKSLKTYL